MLIEFKELTETAVPNLNGGEGTISAKMSVHKNCKMMIAKIPAGASIGMHIHETSDDINYVISGSGTAICGRK
ncbi:MAG: cupin domain-containing protein, partial [Oscillospiraceae bacterium]|nr:cupin domain-containing protein [Oscillospiraceae bacterium]